MKWSDVRQSPNWLTDDEKDAIDALAQATHDGELSASEADALVQDDEGLIAWWKQRTGTPTHTYESIIGILPVEGELPDMDKLRKEVRRKRAERYMGGGDMDA